MPYRDLSLFYLIQVKNMARIYDQQQADLIRRKLQRHYHPDKSAHKEALFMSKQINQAYEILANKAKHAHYYFYGRDTQQEAPFSVDWKELDLAIELLRANKQLTKELNLTFNWQTLPNEPGFDVYEHLDGASPPPSPPAPETPPPEPEEDDGSGAEQPSGEDDGETGDENTNNATDKENKEEANEEPSQAPTADSSHYNDPRRRSYMRKVEKILGHQDRKGRKKGLEFKVKWHGVNIRPAFESAQLLAQEFPRDLRAYIESLGPRQQNHLVKNYDLIADLVAKSFE